MKRKLRAKDHILLALGLIGAALDEFRDPGGLVSASYEQVYGFTPSRFKKQNFQKTVSRLYQAGEIEKKIIKGKPYLCFTNQGSQRWSKDFPLFSWQKKPWDGRWRMVIFDIEEKRRTARDGLRQKLFQLGFGMLQKSVWISPYDFTKELNELLENYGLLGKARIFIAKEGTGVTGRELALEVWPLKNLNDSYEEILKEWDQGRSLHQEEKEKIKKKLKERFFELLLADPLLPKELLPDDWLGTKAFHLISMWR